MSSSSSTTVPNVLHPKRAAHASIRGYLYQTYLGVLRWLALGPGEVLVCEGNEDLDLLFEGVNVYEQAKAYTEAVGFHSTVVTECLSNFARDYATLCQQGQRPRFVFTTTAPRKSLRSRPDLLEVWANPSRRAEVVEVVRDRLASSKLDGLAEARAWLDAEPVRWETFVGSIEWFFGEGFEEVHSKIKRLLAARQDTRRLPAEIFADRLAVAVLEASSRRNVQERSLTQENLEALACTSKEELEGWAESAEARRFRSAFEEAKQLDLLLFANTRELPPDAGPGKLLSAAYEVIPFDDAGRREELEMLERWCNVEDRRSVFLLTGEGGSGKTRLMIEWCKRLREQGWHAGFFRPDRGTESLDSLFEGVLPRLVVLDYAETRLGLIEPLLLKMALAYSHSGPKLRLLLLARHSGDWWTGLARQGEAIEDLLLLSPEPRTISPLVLNSDRRTQVFEAARHAFAAHIRPCPSERGEKESREKQRRDAAPDLSSKDYDRVLYIHMAALLSVLDQGVSGTKDILKRVLNHERTYWSYQVLELKLDTSLSGLVRDAIEPVVAGLTLVGGARDQAQAQALLDRLLRPFPLRPDLSVAMLRLLHRLYFGTRNQEGRYFDPLQPDILGEQLVHESLTKDAELIARILGGANREEQYSILTVLTRLAREREDAHFLHITLREKLEPLVEVALDVAVTEGDPIGIGLSEAIEGCSIDLLAKLVTECNRERYRYSLPLREVTGAATARLLALRKELWHHPTKEQSAELAWLENILGVRFVELGRYEDAFKSAYQATGRYARLAQDHPEEFSLFFATSLLNLGRALKEVGRREDALFAMQEAVSWLRELNEHNPGCFGRELSIALSNLGIALSSVGRREDALQILHEATDLLRPLAQEQPEIFLPQLAVTITNLGMELGALGRWEAALQSTQEAVILHRQLVRQRPDAFLPGLADSLHQLGLRLSTLGRYEDAVQAIKEAIALRTQLAQRRPTFLPGLASSINELGEMLIALGHREDALQAIQKAVTLQRQLVQQRPNTLLPDLAYGLNSLAISLSELRRNEEALAAIEEAVNIRRQLVQQRPEVFTLDLAMSIENLSICLGRTGQREQALQLAREAVELYRKLAPQRPEALFPVLARSLSNLGVILGEAGLHEDALRVTQEGVDIQRQLALRLNVFLPDLAVSLNNLGIRFKERGRLEDALRTAQEAVELYRQLAPQRPDAFLSYLSESLNNLSNRLSEVGRDEEALRAMHEAIDIQRQLAQQQPDAFLPSLVTSLGNLCHRLAALEQYEKAFIAVTEAIQILRPFFLRSPKAFASLMRLTVELYISTSRSADREPDQDLLFTIKKALEIA